ncbi:hypothetical protein evm_013600 [Chilo suppressalis]|nr:hypothetical protein evm_013600 [Chilo suppressalis]
METWDCCRTCLSNESLCPIYGGHENFIDVVYLAIGINIEPNDNLPQLMCSTCINFTKEICNFKKNAESAQVKLLERLESKEFKVIKPEFLIVKTENELPTLDSFTELNNDCDDDDDDVPLRNLQHKSNFEIDKEKIELEITPKEETYNIEYKPKSTNKKKNASEKRLAKRKVRSKKENSEEQKSSKEKKGVKEEIECEYCHKILTSKLSMRNHYKIHTGFDFVCEHCGKKFITRRLLLMHCRAKHGYEKTDKCSYCDYKASNAEQVKVSLLC